MKSASIVLFAAIVGLWAKGSAAEMTPEQVQKAEAFIAEVRALDPHTQESEPAFQALVAKYVPATGPVQGYLDFMTASGFECPWEHSLSDEIDREMPTYRCTFKPDLGRSGEPSLSSVTEIALFDVAADCDKDRNVMTVKGSMTHGFVGP